MMNDEKRKLDCYIVKDLLPLYYDDVVSENTKNAVKDHLGNCEDCLKEYRGFCVDMPATKEENTGKRFSKMMNKQKIRQRIKMAAAALIACLVLVGSYYFLTQTRLVCINDMEVYKACRYYTEDGAEKFFLLFSTEATGYTMDLETSEENGKVICELSLKRPVIRKKREERSVTTADFVVNGCDVLICEGVTVWTKDMNGNDTVPDYVYALEYFEEHNEEESNEFSGEEQSKSEYGIAMFIRDDTIGITSKDRTIRWNFDGEVVYDSGKATEKVK